MNEKDRTNDALIFALERLKSAQASKANPNDLQIALLNRIDKKLDAILESKRPVNEKAPEPIVPEQKKQKQGFIKKLFG